MTEELLQWGLRTGLVVSGLIGLVLLLRRPFAKYLGAEATFLLWSLPALRLLMPEVRLPVKDSIEFAPLNALPYAEMELFMAGMFNDKEAVGENITAPVPALNQIDILGIIAVLWVAGGVLWLSYHLIRHYKFSRLLRNVSSLPDASLTANIEKARQLMGLTRSPKIMTAPKAIGPLVTGIINPLIIVPKDFAAEYSNDAQLFALCHEFSHIKRRDVIWAFALLIFRAVHWYNPLVHYAAKRFRLDQEAACDAHTLAKFGRDADAHEYALTLLMSEQVDGPTGNMPALSLAMNDSAMRDANKGTPNDIH